MTDEEALKEALKEIDRQEKRFAAVGCGRGLRLAKSTREKPTGTGPSRGG